MLGGDGSKRGKNTPVCAPGGPHTLKSRGPCAEPRAVPGWSGSLAGDGTRILAVAMASARLPDLRGRALPGQDLLAPGVAEPQ